MEIVNKFKKQEKDFNENYNKFYESLNSEQKFLFAKIENRYKEKLDYISSLLDRDIEERRFIPDTQ